MDYENPPVQEKRRLYPERASANIDSLIEKLEALDTSKAEKIELSEEERKGLLEFEDKLGRALEKIHSLDVTSVTFYPEYFLTDAGQEDLTKALGISDEEIQNLDIIEIEKLLYSKRVDLTKNTSLKELKNLAGRSEKYSNEKILSSLKESLQDNGQISIEGINNPKRNSILLNPQTALEKISGFEIFRREISRIKNELGEQKLDKAKLGILELYRRKVNELVLEQYSKINLVSDAANILGEESLSKYEKELLSLVYGSKAISGKREYLRSIADKITYGASEEYDEQGMRRQISDEIREYAEILETDYAKNEVEKKRIIAEQGLDAKKIFATNVTADTSQKYAEEVLEYYGLKSEQSADQYDPSRKGSAPDNKWQAVVDLSKSTASIDNKKRIEKIPGVPKDIINSLSVLAGHEIEGHIFQAENRKLIPLRLFQKIGGDRSGLFAEGGAMLAQDEISKKAFGFDSIPRPYYAKAMQKRLEGGNYLECVKAHYDSSLNILRAQLESGLIDKDQFKLEIEDNLKLATDRTRRIFRGSGTSEGGFDLASASNLLTNSKNTLYLEQKILLDKLKEKGLEKYAFLGKVNLESLITLSEIGLLDPSKIRMPEYYAVNIWERIKDQYKT